MSAPRHVQNSIAKQMNSNIVFVERNVDEIIFKILDQNVRLLDNEKFTIWKNDSYANGPVMTKKKQSKTVYDEADHCYLLDWFLTTI